MRLSLLEARDLVYIDLCTAAYAIGLGYLTRVGLSRVPHYYNLAGLDVRPHFHGSPSCWSSYAYGPGNGTLAIKERGCHRGIALAHQPWAVPFMDRYPC